MLVGPLIRSNRDDTYNSLSRRFSSTVNKFQLVSDSLSQNVGQVNQGINSLPSRFIRVSVSQRDVYTRNLLKLTDKERINNRLVCLE